MPAKRKSYGVEYEKAIVQDSRDKNLAALCKEKKLDLRMVRKWRAQYDKLCEKMGEGSAKKRKCGSGRQPLFPELEDIICEWIADRRAQAFIVRRSDVQAFALETASHLEISTEKFKASQHWLDSFLQRHELSLRRSTTLFKLEDTEVIKRALAFKSFVGRIDFSKYQLFHMIAMDETAVFMGQGFQTTIDRKGASSIYIPSTGYESARVTCILAIRLDGKKAPPLIITKGKKNEIERVSERRIDQVMIPAGMTAYLQTLDIGINKPFKDNLRIEINYYIENKMERNQRGNFMRPTLQDVATWVKNSWDKITDSCVANALPAGYLDKECSFKESSIARHERLGSMVLQEMKSKEIQAEFRIWRFMKMSQKMMT
ncbi:centromere binding protein B, DNA binding protein [Trichuris suis]|nr:centromere binding protein B, DNA binding protein [Trichuris suis]